MDSEDICLSVFLCICVGEGMGGKNKLSVPSRTCESGYVRQNQVDYTLHLLNYYLSSGHFFFCIYPF